MKEKVMSVIKKVGTHGWIAAGTGLVCGCIIGYCCGKKNSEKKRKE